jgi:hypothetical protein
VRWLNKISERLKFEQQLEGQEWRRQLQVGDYIDAVQTYHTPNNNNGIKGIQGWTPAKIAEIDEEDRLIVSFLRTPRNGDVRAKRTSLQIA